MKIEIKVPQLPESVSEAVLLDWNKKVGESIKREENLIDLETDKVILELPSPEDGVIAQLVARSGDVVTSGQIIAYIETDVLAVASESQIAPVVANVEPVVAIAQPTPVASAPSVPSVSTNVVMPAAAKIAADNAVNTAEISGSGRGGRVLKEDVVKSIANVGSSRFEERVPMSRLRKRIAERLLESQHTNAILTTFNEVNMKPIMDLRAKYKDIFEKKHGTKLGFMSFFVKAAVHGMKQFPVLNASIDGDDVVYHNYFDIGIAVSSPRGLVVPILRNVENMNIAQIEKQIVEYGKLAKDGKLGMDDLTGGTFSITNGGTFGSMMSTPIINPPQSAILGMHAIKDRAVVENGQIVIRPMMYLALSYDHRIIDGREAVSCLVAIKDALEDPTRLIMDI